MEISLTRLENIETTRRNLLKYGTFAGISALAGINGLQSSHLLPPVISASHITNTSKVIDYTTQPYSVFLVSNNINIVKSVLNNTRVETIYLYSSVIDEVISSRVKTSFSIKTLLLSLGTVIPFDYDISSLDMKSWRVADAFSYLSGAYAELQNNSQATVNEAQLLSSLEVLGKYNKTIYLSSTTPWQKSNILSVNLNVSPIGNIVSL